MMTVLLLEMVVLRSCDAASGSVLALPIQPRQCLVEARNSGESSATILVLIGDLLQ